jgi:hypothetical protein
VLFSAISLFLFSFVAFSPTGSAPYGTTLLGEGRVVESEALPVFDTALFL